jgi:hypothetical protein
MIHATSLIIPLHTLVGREGSARLDTNVNLTTVLDNGCEHELEGWVSTRMLIVERQGYLQYVGGHRVSQTSNLPMLIAISRTRT